MSTIKDLAAILSKAQGRIDRETGEPIDIGAEVVRIRARESALAEFVAAFDEWREAPEGDGLSVDLCDQKMRPYAERLHEARETLDATEDLPA